MLLECRPAKIVAAEYKTLPFPALMPIQEVAFDLGITATDTPLELAGVVIQGYNDHQLLFEQRWPARIIRRRLGEENLRIERGMGLALRSLHFQLHAYEPLTSVELVVLAQVDGKDELEHATLEIPVQFHSQKTNLYFPLRGAWWAIQGSDWSDRHKQEVLSQAYALDFAKLGPDNRTFGGRGTAREEHYSWDQPVYAAAGGKVAAVTYDMPDLVPGVLPDPLMFRGDPRRTLGNSVAVSHGNGEFSYYGCLQQASVAVNEGQIIKRGALLGRVGNSGVSPGPHLHFHLADGPHPFIDQGLPAVFSHFWAGGQFFTQPTTIPTRMIVIGEED
jgi:hypothetical protein